MTYSRTKSNVANFKDSKITGHGVSKKFMDYMREEVLRIVFIKDDGSRRVMYATLAPSYITGNLIPSSGSPYDPRKSGVIRVIDVELGAWRSIRVSSVVTWCVCLK